MGVLCWIVLTIKKISDIEGRGEGSLGIKWMVSYFGLTQQEARSLLTLLSLWYSYATHDKTIQKQVPLPHQHTQFSSLLRVAALTHSSALTLTFS